MGKNVDLVDSHICLTEVAMQFLLSVCGLTSSDRNSLTITCYSRLTLPLANFNLPVDSLIDETVKFTISYKV